MPLAVVTGASQGFGRALARHLAKKQWNVVNLTSSASVEAYPGLGFGGYGASKAALDQVTKVLGADNPELRFYAFDPGQMRTEMWSQAAGGADMSHLPGPETVVPALMRMLERRPPSGRYLVSEFAEGDQ